MAKKLIVVFDDKMRAVGSFSEETPGSKSKEQPAIGIRPLAGQKIMNVEISTEASGVSHRNILKLLNNVGEKYPTLSADDLPIKVRAFKDIKS